MLCVKLTIKGMKEIKQIESRIRNDPSFEESFFDALMNINISDSSVDFYRQIPCIFSQDPSVCGDIRKVDKEIARLKQTAFTPGCDLW